MTVTVGAPHFVFVASGRFHEPVRPSAVIVNNTTIINQTTVINNVKRENRTIGGGPRQVVVNEGPGLEVVQKATGKQVKARPIQEVASKTSVPPEVSRRQSGDTKGKAKPSVSPSEQPKSAPDRKATPGENRERPVNPAPPKKDPAPPKKDKPDKPRGKEEPSFATPEQPGSAIEQDKLRDREKPSIVPPEQPRSIPERKVAPNENRTVNPTAPDKGKENILRRSERPPVTGKPPPRTSKPPKGKDKGTVPIPEPKKKSSEKDKP